MAVYDLVREQKAYYNAPADKVQLIDIGAADYAAITGNGDPNGPVFAAAVQALYKVVYTLKFRCKAGGEDFKVPKLEALWWFDREQYGHLSMAEAPLHIPRESWQYRLLLRLPPYISRAELEQAKAAAAAGKAIPRITEVDWFSMQEGKSAQILHRGPFDREPETLTLLQDYLQQHGLSVRGPHHEIYLSDFRKTSPDKLKTILREPLL